MAINPCCMPLEKGVIIMAVVDIIFAIGKLIVTILDFTAIYRDNLKPTQTEKNISITFGIILVIGAIMGLLLSLRLYFGAKKRDIKNCKIWLIVKIILFFVDLISISVNSSEGDYDSKYETSVVTVTIIILIYRVYMMYCVYRFIQELKMDQQRVGFQARLEGGVAYATNTPTSPYTITTTYPQPHSSNNQNRSGGVSNPNHQFNNNSVDNL